jgi:transposase
LWRNLCDAVERLVARLRAQWAPPAPEPELEQGPASVPDKPEGRLARRARERHAAARALKDKGAGVTRIAAELRLSPKTVRKFMRAAGPEELSGGPVAGHPAALDEHAGYLAARLAEGCTSTRVLHQELRDRGARVSERTVRRFLRRLRENTAPAAGPPVPKSREVTTLALTGPDNLAAAEGDLLAELRGRCVDLDAACNLVGRFAEMLVGRRGKDKLAGWVHDAEHSALPELRTFAAGLGKDWDAVTAGLTLDWNSGQVEGHVSRIKMIKRQMFGRAKPDLLRKRILASS